MALDLSGSAVILPAPPESEGWPRGLRRTLEKRVYVKTVPWVRIPLPPPVPLRNLFSAQAAGPEKPRIPAVFGDNLWTADRRNGSKSALSPPLFSGPLDCVDAVRKSETQDFRHFPRDAGANGFAWLSGAGRPENETQH